MFDPISIGLALLLSTAKDALQSEAAKAVFSGIIGNRADHLFTSGFRKIKDILNLRSSAYPENHDLLRTLRMSMLKATEMLYLNMKEDEEEKQFRKKLKVWVDEQMEFIPTLSKWADWENPASGELELFFTGHESHTDKKVLMIEKMTTSWEKYIRSQLKTELPQAFTSRLKQGWLEDEKRIYWHEATMVLMIEALRNPKDEQSIRASKAFEHNFLSDIKLQLSDIHELLLTQFANNESIVKLADAISSQQATIASQQTTAASQQTTIASQQRTIEVLTEDKQWMRQQLTEYKLRIEVLQSRDQTNPLEDKELKELIKQRDELISNNNFLVEKESESLLTKRSIEKKYFSIILPQVGLDKVPEESKREKAEYAFKLGNIEIRNLNQAKGIELLKESVLLYPENHSYRIRLATVLNEIGESYKAWNVISVYYEETSSHIDPLILKRIFNLAGIIGMSLNKFEDAKVHLNAALDVHIQNHGKIVYQGAEVIIHNLSIVYEELGEHEKAIYYSKMSLDSTLLIHGKRSYEAVITWASYANLLLNIGNLISAQRIATYCITLFDKHKIKFDICYSRLYFLLARKYKLELNYSQAHSAISESYKILSIVYGENSIRTIPAIKFKASIYHAQFDDELELKELMKIYDIIQGPIRFVDHFGNGDISSSHLMQEISQNDFIECSIGIANCLYNLKRYDSIPGYLQLAYNLLIISKEEHTHLAAYLLNQIGLAYYMAKSDDKAIDYYVQALEKHIELKLNNEDNLVIEQNIEAIENNLANAWLSKGDLKKAIHHYENSLQILRSKLSDQTDTLIRALNNLGSALRDDLQFKIAIERKSEALKLSHDFFGAEHETTITIKKSLALTIMKMEESQNNDAN